MTKPLDGKTVVITGATSGIGQVTAEALAAQGARIVQVARSRERGEAALARLREEAPGIEHQVVYADLLRLSEMKRIGAELATQLDRVDILLNNAGALFGSYQEVEGLERTFALNHLSYFVLSWALRDRLRSTAPARVVNTASDAHLVGTVDFDDLQSSRLFAEAGWRARVRFGGPAFMVYGRSKLFNILFTRELARRLAPGVTANCVHPGFVATRFGSETGGLMSFALHAAKLVALKPEQGAETLIYLSTSPDVASTTGEYFHKKKVMTPSVDARNDDLARRLWKESERLTGCVWTV
jgi:NAD(P)-dependent dehydrogenase (short-subunit alcohol dehydrogenase family)